jgi:hypothetical protein
MDGTTSMKALIIYDDLTGATRAATALKRAAWRANVSADWDIKPWRTDALKFPSVADKAANADLIVLAGPQAHSLPTWLEEWLRCWVIRRNIEDAALAGALRRKRRGFGCSERTSLVPVCRGPRLEAHYRKRDHARGPNASHSTLNPHADGLCSQPQKLRFPF